MPDTSMTTWVLAPTRTDQLEIGQTVLVAPTGKPDSEGDRWQPAQNTNGRPMRVDGVRGYTPTHRRVDWRDGTTSTVPRDLSWLVRAYPPVTCPNCGEAGTLRIEVEAVAVYEALHVADGKLIADPAEPIEMEAFTLTCRECGDDAELADVGASGWASR